MVKYNNIIIQIAAVVNLIIQDVIVHKHGEEFLKVQQDSPLDFPEDAVNARNAQT